MAITDAFTNTNGTTLTSHSANWVMEQGADTNLTIQSNALDVGISSADFFARRNDGSFPADQYSQIVLTRLVTGVSTAYLGPCVRMQSGAVTMYAYYTRAAGAGVTNGLWEITAGSFSQLGSNATHTPAVNDIFKLTASGTTLTPNINGATTNTPGAQTDASLASGYPGLLFSNNAAPAQTGRCDSFECSDLAAGNAARAMRMLEMMRNA